MHPPLRTDDPKADPSWPPRPAFAALANNEERQKIFGPFNFVADPQPNNKEHIRILGDWVEKNIVKLEIPQLKGVKNAPKTVAFHTKGADALVKMFAAWEKAGLIGRILTWEGSFVPRFVRGSTKSLSNHAFGTAFDINARWNAMGSQPALIGKEGVTRELVPIANEHGFFWGGHFTRPDGMHFEVAVVK